MAKGNFLQSVNQDLFSIAVEEYLNHRYTDKYPNDWGEEYKYEILENLNNELSLEEVNEDTILDLAETLHSSKSNFVHWTNTTDLKEFAEDEPKVLARQFHNLFDETKPLDERISAFREKGRDYDPDIRLGTPLFGYILAAFDREKYTIYNHSAFQDFADWFNLDFPPGVGKKYRRYIEVCSELKDYFNQHNVLQDRTATLLDAQDFIFLTSDYSGLRFKIALRFLSDFSRKLAEYEEKPADFLEEIKNMDEEYLKAKREEYENSQKVKRVRYEILDAILEDDDFVNLDTVKNIMERVNEDYGKDILHSWDEFKILFEIYHSNYKNMINTLLGNIHDILREKLEEEEELEDVEFTPGGVINDFSWNQNFGSTRAGIMLYPDRNESYRDSAQLFLAFHGGKVEYGLYLGDRVETNKEKDLEEKYDSESLYLEDVVGKFKSVIPFYREINKKYWKISPGENAFKWDEFLEGNYIAIGWDEIDYPEEEIRKQIEEKNLGIEPKYIEKQFGYFVDDMKRGDIVLSYGSKTVLDIGKIKGGYYKEESADNFQHQRDVRWLEVSEFPAEELGEDFYDRVSVNQTIVPIENQKFIKKIKGKITGENVEELTSLPSLDLSNDLIIDGLYFPGKEKTRLKSQISSAIENGKYIILIGPPGTGKSKLAKEICSSYVGDNYQMVTANSDWSTFDTIGGYHPEEEGSLLFQPGIFLESFKDNATNDPKNQWLILDEINRADIDKAFGALFSALTGDEINLSFKADNGKSIVVRPQEEDEESVKPTDHEHIIPKDWRLIATMNTYDKTSLYEMSYAFMRRFAFIPVPAPEQDSINEDLVENYLDVWGIENSRFAGQVARLWEEINDFRKVGPATIEDIYKTLLQTMNGLHDTELDYSSALIMHVLPQFEGLLEDDITDFITSLSELSPNMQNFDENDMSQINQFASEYFQINKEKLPDTE